MDLCYACVRTYGLVFTGVLVLQVYLYYRCTCITGVYLCYRCTCITGVLMLQVCTCVTGVLVLQVYLCYRCTCVTDVLVLQVDLFSTPRRRLLIEFTVLTLYNKTVNGITDVDPWYGYTVKPVVQVRVYTCCKT